MANLAIEHYRLLTAAAHNATRHDATNAQKFTNDPVSGYSFNQFLKDFSRSLTLCI